MYVRTKQGESHVLLEMPHSGKAGLAYRGYRATDGLPQNFASLVRFESAEVRKTLGFGCDAAAPALSGYSQLINSPSLSLSGIRNGLARAFVDCNRDRTEVSGLALTDADTRRHHHGVIWARTVLMGLDSEALRDEKRLNELVNTECEPVLRDPLRPKEFADLMRLGYEPYHAQIREQHRRIVERHGRCVHVALHTLPAFDVALSQGGYVCGPPARRGPLDPQNGSLPDVILIHNGYAAADPRYVNAIRDAFTEAGLVVSDGSGPFLGSNGVTKMYGDPANGVHVIGIEHVTHGGIEPRRNDGCTTVNEEKARAFQSVYRKAILNLLNGD